MRIWPLDPIRMTRPAKVIDGLVTAAGLLAALAVTYWPITLIAVGGLWYVVAR